MNKRGDFIDLLHMFGVFVFGTSIFILVGYLVFFWLSSAHTAATVTGEAFLGVDCVNENCTDVTDGLFTILLVSIAISIIVYYIYQRKIK